MCEVIYVEFDHTRILVVPCKSLGRGEKEEGRRDWEGERKEERIGGRGKGGKERGRRGRKREEGRGRKREEKKEERMRK